MLSLRSSLSLIHSTVKSIRPLVGRDINLPFSSRYYMVDAKYFNIDDPKLEYTPNKDECLKFYKEMKSIRLLELECDKLFKQRMIRGYCHLYDGQEAIAVGIKNGTNIGDDVVTSYRCHGFYYLYSGGNKESCLKLFKELLGREGGCSNARGGSMHLFDSKNYFWGGNGIVGDQMSIGTGLGLYNKLTSNNKINNISLCLCGDGAFNQGQLYESINMAKLWKLPVIYCIENNQYSMGTPTKESSSILNYYKLFNNINGIYVKTNSIYNILNIIKYAREYVINNGPLIIEFNTYRYRGHSMSDPGLSYRTRDEIQKIKNTLDPIEWIKQLMISEKYFNEDDFQAINDEMSKSISDAAQLSIRSPEPHVDELTKYVYKDYSTHVRTCDINTILTNIHM